ncbi:MAG: SDR family oxidoreductase [Acidobacteria bacterium]|nr:SDR family oxidoreductase [Acidobacteriota bacterium]
MKILFIGGTGIISTACTELAAERGMDVTLVRRGQRGADLPPGIRTIEADIDDIERIRKALAGEKFDSVVDFIAFTPEQIERDIALFRGITRQFVFVSTASAYQKPVGHYLITESTPLANPFWEYSQLKIACEDRLMRAYREEGFPFTVIRPSLTYSRTQITLPVNTWAKSYTVVDRMRQGKPVIVPGDGMSLWVITHNTDFAKGLVGLLGLNQAIGHAFHITSDEAMTWDQYYTMVAEAAGVEPRLVHIPIDFLSACVPEMHGGLRGDKAVSVVFDNTKIKRFVPGYQATKTYAAGVRETIAWFDADDGRKQIDAEAGARWDRLIDAWQHALAAGVQRFQAL